MNTMALMYPRLTSAWRWPAVAMLVYVLALLLVFRDTAMAMVTIWIRSETFAHAFVVPPISLWLIWRQRQLLAGLAHDPRRGCFCLWACWAFCGGLPAWYRSMPQPK